MAKAPRGNASDATDAQPDSENAGPIEGEQPLDGMPDIAADAAEDEEDKAKRPQVPPGMRTLYNEVARLSGFLALARRAIYAGDAAKVAKALALLERAAPDAREIAELSVE